MNRDWRFTKEEYSCGLRVAGVLARDGKILVQKDKSAPSTLCLAAVCKSEKQPKRH